MVNMHRFSSKQTQSSSRPSWPWWPVNNGRLNFLTSGKFWCWFPSQCWPSLFLITAKIIPWTALLEGFDNRDEADHDDGLEARQEDDHHQDEVQSGLFGSGDLAKFPWPRKLHSAFSYFPGVWRWWRDFIEDESHLGSPVEDIIVCCNFFGWNGNKHYGYIAINSNRDG